MKNLLDTKTASLQEILGNGKKYKIPDFQRDYSWNENNWEDLWTDCIALKENSIPHYMGAIVLQNTKKKNYFIVVDGQQRLTTITILIVAIINFLSELIDKQIDISLNQERIEQIQRKFIGEKTISKLHYESKLKLNKNNDVFFQDRILNRKEPISYAKLRDSEKLLYNAYIYFKQKIIDFFKDDNGEKVSEFLEDIISDRLIFIQITVDDELSAYTVFETLNARGIDLTATDLLKNYLFAVSAKTMSESEMNLLKEKWEQIVDNVGLKEFPVFLRYVLNAKQDLVRKEYLFKAIKTTVKTAEDVFDLVDELEQKANLYNAIKNPEDDFWNSFPGDNHVSIRKSLRELKLFGVTQPIPLLFSLSDNMPDMFSDFLKKIVVISLRYNIIAKKNPNELERVYNDIAKKIFNKIILNKFEIIELLKKVYINDNDFKHAFAYKELKTGGKSKKIVKYILTKIENHISGKDNDFNDASFTIEHILPENYSGEWNKLFDNHAQRYVYRLGNYTLLESALNKKCGNKNFIAKKEIYSKSKYKLTREYINFDEWNIQNLDSYQRKMAKQALSVWKI